MEKSKRINIFVFQKFEIPEALIGFMGTGKTSVGKALAEMLNYKFIDLDEEIIKISGKIISTARKNIEH